MRSTPVLPDEDERGRKVAPGDWSVRVVHGHEGASQAAGALTVACMRCLIRAKGGAQRLEELADHLRLAFSTAQPGQGGAPPACAGYKLHVHRESRRGGDPRHMSLACALPGMPACAALLALCSS